MSTKQQQTIRDQIIWGDKSPALFARIDSITLEQLHELNDNGFLDLDQTQNESPSVAEIMDFMTKFPQFTAHGYAISSSRPDMRVSLEGVECHSPLDKEATRAFIALFRLADEFELTDTYARCWYD